MNTSALTVLFVPIVGLLLYRRFRNAFSRQPVILWRMIVRFVFLGAIAVIITVRSPSQMALAGQIAGLVVGVGLALLGIKHTKIELTSQGLFYTPNKWIGLAVTALFVGRLAARIFMSYSSFATDPAQAPGRPAFLTSGASAITLSLFCLMAGYYCAYNAALWRKSKALSAAPVAA